MGNSSFARLKKEFAHPALATVERYQNMLSMLPKQTRREFVEKNVLTLFRLQLKAMRKKLGLSQAQMAKRLQVAQTRYSVIENGSKAAPYISLQTAMLIAEVFDCSVQVSLVSFLDQTNAIHDEVKPITPFILEYNYCDMRNQEALAELRIEEKRLIKEGNLSDAVGLTSGLTEDERRLLRLDYLETGE